MSSAKTLATDSRRYIFSYAIRSPEDVPADFPTPSEPGFRIGVFLPRDDPDWFGRSRFPPRVAVLGADSIVVQTHPACGGSSVRIRLADLAFYEVGRILLIGWLRFVAAASEILLPYNTRADRPITEFLEALAQAYLPGSQDPRRGEDGGERGGEEMVALGPPLDIKFHNHLLAALREGERLHVRWFSPPRQTAPRWGPLRIRTQIAGDLLALTDKRILWITDRRDGRYERYGSITRTGRLRGIETVGCERDRDEGELMIAFGEGAHWRIPVGRDRIEAAQSCAEAFSAHLSRRQCAPTP
jgi:hypothetical protein